MEADELKPLELLGAVVRRLVIRVRPVGAGANAGVGVGLACGPALSGDLEHETDRDDAEHERCGDEGLGHEVGPYNSTYSDHGK